MVTPPPPPPLVAYPTVPTAMHDDGSLDLDAQAALAATLAAAGADGLLALGLTTGEAELLDADERASVVDATRRGAGGLPVAVGIGLAGPTALAAARAAASTGADLLVVGVPRGSAAPDALGAVASIGLPLWLHHHALLAGGERSAGELDGLATEVDAAAVVVEQAPTADLVADLDVPTRGGLAGLYLLEELEVGSGGTVAGVAVPEALLEVLRAWQAGDRGGARDRFVEVAAYLRLEAGGPGLRIRKEAWRQRGVLTSGRVRRGAPLGAATKRAVTRRLRELGTPLTDPYPD